MIKDLFSLREDEIFQTLKAISDHKFVLIGGYAVNAYTLPRFSVDCDIVVKEDIELKKIEAKLLKIGYIKELARESIPYSGNFVRYEKKIKPNFSVSVDILITKVTDRMTGVEFQAEWIFEHAKKSFLLGKTIREELSIQIIDIDALLVMKMIACRSTDIRDVFMMLPSAINTEWIKSEISLRYNLQDRVEKIMEKVTSTQFKDGLSGVYGYIDQSVFEKHIKAVQNLI